MERRPGSVQDEPVVLLVVRPVVVVPLVASGAVSSASLRLIAWAPASGSIALSTFSPMGGSANRLLLSLSVTISLPPDTSRLACSCTTPAASWTVGLSLTLRAARTSSSYFSLPARAPRTNPAASPPRNNSLPRIGDLLLLRDATYLAPW